MLSADLNVFLARLNTIHKAHGLNILANHTKSRRQKLWTTLGWVSILGLQALLFAGSIPYLTSNDKFQRLMCITCLVINLQVCSQELLFVSKKKAVLEVVDWCHQVEMQPLNGFNRPAFWFLDVREYLTWIIGLYHKITITYSCISCFGVPILRSLLESKPTLNIDLNLRGFEEGSNAFAFVLEFLVLTFSVNSTIHLCFFSLSFFIFFSSYVVAQLELVAIFVQQLELTELELLARQLKQITSLHLDALDTIEKLHQLYKWNLKMQEALLFSGFAVALIGKERVQLSMITLPFFLMAFNGFYSFTVDKMIDAEESIRDEYYSLEWYTAPVKIRKMLLIAMQQPKEVTFGGIFGKDRTSLVRFAETVRQAYDFGLILLKAADIA